MRRTPLRPPPGLSRLSQEVTFDDPDSETELPQISRQIPAPKSDPSFDYKHAHGNAEDVDMPLLPSNFPQTVRFPLTENVDADSRSSASRSWNGQRKRQPEYTYSSIVDDPFLEGHEAHLRQPNSWSAGAHCSITPPSSSKFIKTPPSTGYALDSRFPRTPKPHPFAKSFEAPQWRKLAIHILLCALAYPFLLVFVVTSRGKSLFWARLFVGAGCGLLGFMMGSSLLRLARGILEAAAWATVIHQSRVPDSQGSGVRLKDLAAHSDDPTSSIPAFRLIWDRHSYPGADRDYRKFYDTRQWSLWIAFFLVNVLLAGTLTFILARVVDIDVDIVHQHQTYYEVAVSADLSDADLKRAQDLQNAFQSDALAWTLVPFSLESSLPSVVSLSWNNDSVYFSEVTLSQLIPGGSGFGTFETGTTSPSLGLKPQDPMQAVPSNSVEPGSILRFPRWGIRIKCAKIPDIPNNIIPLSENNLTYLFTPRDTIRGLFQNFEMDFPQGFEAPLNFTQVMHPNDTLPSGLDPSGIATGAVFWDSGVAHSTNSTPLSLGEDGNGFVTMENVLVRLNTSFAPHGSFGVVGNFSLPDKDGYLTFIGYDAAVCLELYEPWVLEVSNSSVGSPTSMRIVDKAASIKDLNTQLIKEKIKGRPLDDPLTKRALNSTDLKAAYIIAHHNSVNQMLKDNGRNANYMPSSSLISFTGGDGPYGYTSLSEVDYAKFRALADARNVLPYLAGSGLSVGRRYRDKIVTTTTINNLGMAILIVVVFLMGLISALFVPRLPLDMPRRGFDLYSWVSGFYAQELVAEAPGGISKNMELEDLADLTSDLKFRYVGGW
ncbi:hypothetical protein BDZ97DRAFT_1865139 [Flammula alnicola]|nr:hypothetical protein BDZ97DRAFT_1865139 [Flammula alnicola]